MDKGVIVDVTTVIDMYWLGVWLCPRGSCRGHLLRAVCCVSRHWDWVMLRWCSHPLIWWLLSNVQFLNIHSDGQPRPIDMVKSHGTLDPLKKQPVHCILMEWLLNCSRSVPTALHLRLWVCLSEVAANAECHRMGAKINGYVRHCIQCLVMLSAERCTCNLREYLQIYSQGQSTWSNQFGTWNNWNGVDVVFLSSAVCTPMTYLKCTCQGLSAGMVKDRWEEMESQTHVTN